VNRAAVAAAISAILALFGLASTASRETARRRCSIVTTFTSYKHTAARSPVRKEPAPFEQWSENLYEDGVP
jgi:hypothetical protein